MFEKAMEQSNYKICLKVVYILDYNIFLGMKFSLPAHKVYVPFKLCSLGLPNKVIQLSRYFPHLLGLCFTAFMMHRLCTGSLQINWWSMTCSATWSQLCYKTTLWPKSPECAFRWGKNCITPPPASSVRLCQHDPIFPKAINYTDRTCMLHERAYEMLAQMLNNTKKKKSSQYSWRSWSSNSLNLPFSWMEWIQRLNHLLGPIFKIKHSACQPRGHD